MTATFSANGLTVAGHALTCLPARQHRGSSGPGTLWVSGRFADRLPAGIAFAAKAFVERDQGGNVGEHEILRQREQREARSPGTGPAPDPGTGPALRAPAPAFQGPRHARRPVQGYLREPGSGVEL